jgi:serine protease Do
MAILVLVLSLIPDPNSNLLATFYCYKNVKSQATCLLLSWFLIAVMNAAPLQAADHPHDFDEFFSGVIKASKPAVVFIQVERASKKDNPYKDDPELSRFFDTDSKTGISFFSDTTSINFGSGFIFRSDGYILTNSHVVEGAVDISVTLPDNRQFNATLVGTDPKTDIGVVKIEVDNLPAIALGNSDQLKAGQWVLAIGSPYKHIQSVTAGIISATGRNTLGISDYENFIQTDAAINPGNSGGPLVNTAGEAIGINTAFQTQTGGYMGIGFAIPINMARYVSEQLISTGTVARAWLGVALVNADASQLEEQGLATTATAAFVKEVKKDSPALRAGLKEGDLITAIDGFAVASAADLRNRISLSAPYSRVQLTTYRNKIKQNIDVELAKLK